MRALRVLCAAVVAALSLVVTGTLVERVPPEEKRFPSSKDPATGRRRPRRRERRTSRS
ncbi:MAG: hypothetical protein ACXWDI_15790 [Nocardioides sp.]